LCKYFESDEIFNKTFAGKSVIELGSGVGLLVSTRKNCIGIIATVTLFPRVSLCGKNSVSAKVYI